MSLAGDAERWQRVKALLAQALELRTAPQRDFIDRVCEGDTALHQELSSLVAAARNAEGELDSLPAALALEAVQARTSHAWIGRRLGRYRIVSLIAAGGMGEVYRAERADGQYEQHVALKVMRDGLDQASLVARFKAERQILASLDHPNLAKVLDGGVTDDGVPYFVMELVAGDPIDAYADRMQLSIADRVQLFRSVCQVVHYAHQKGVVHRDLKVNNILVTCDGTVKLVDFGIAKRIAAADEQTRTATAQRVMTLVYSSPEQVRGDVITPASDIYSLGVVLYRLLTKASPYPGVTADSAYELTRAICDTEPSPPSKAWTARKAGPAPGRPKPDDAPRGQERSDWGADAKRLRGDLDAVVMMALRKDPQRRYASAEAFSEDLFRHLEGLPVQARRGAWSYRAGRFVLRHRAVVGAAMVANLALIAGIAVAGYQTWQANQQRERAERHFASVRKLANTLIVDVHQAIQGLPGSTAARKLIVDNALSYLQQLSADAKGDPALQVELANGYRHLGDIQGQPYAANTGDARGALESYDRGLALVQDLAAPRRDGQTVYDPAVEALAQLNLRKGALLGSQADDVNAERLLGQAVALMDDLALRGPPSRERQLQRAAAYGQLARTQRHNDRIDAFLASSEASRRQYEQILQEAPDEARAASGLAMTYLDRGTYFLLRDTSTESAKLAEQAFRQAVLIQEPLVARQPNDARLLRNLAAHHANLAAALMRTERPQEAAVAYGRARDLIADIGAKDASNAQIRADLAVVTGSMSKALLANGNADAAVQAAESALRIYAGLPEGSLRDVNTRYKQGVAHYLLGQTLEARAKLPGRDAGAARSDREAACTRYRQGLPILEELGARLPWGPTDITPDMLRQALQRCR